ncbi:MAG: 50S ribosome-binding GTPase [Ruminiclostridium sp.]|nr:50S ribosome-binding GTPase [Ruminiclostridium sp.]
MKEKKDIYEILGEEIMKADIPEEEKVAQLEKLADSAKQQINIMVVGATGSGKSSTINSIFDTGIADVGVGADPETKELAYYRIGNLTIWDTPGIGDSADNDTAYSKLITDKLTETDEKGLPLIDLVLVVIDGSTKDLSSTYRMITRIVAPCISEQDTNRILIAVNQADIAMKGQHWDKENNRPDEVLDRYLKDKCESIRRRIYETTGYKLNPVYYCAGYTDENNIQSKPYNLTKLLYHIVMSLPAKKRIAVAAGLNEDSDMWEYCDDDENYADTLSQSFGEIFAQTTAEIAEKFALAGGVALGVPGSIAGGIIGGIAGAVVGLFKGIFLQFTSAEYSDEDDQDDDCEDEEADEDEQTEEYDEEN